LLTLESENDILYWQPRKTGCRNDLWKL